MRIDNDDVTVPGQCYLANGDGTRGVLPCLGMVSLLGATVWLGGCCSMGTTRFRAAPSGMEFDIVWRASEPCDRTPAELPECPWLGVCEGAASDGVHAARIAGRTDERLAGKRPGGQSVTAADIRECASLPVEE